MQDCVILGSVATFDGVAPDKAQALKVLEEASEVYNAWQVWDECRDDEPNAASPSWRSAPTSCRRLSTS